MLSKLDVLFVLSIIISSGTKLSLDSSFPYIFLLVISFLIILKNNLLQKGISLSFVGLLILGIVVWVLLGAYYNLESYSSIFKYSVLILSVGLCVLSRPEKAFDLFKCFAYLVVFTSIPSNLIFILKVIGVNVPLTVYNDIGTAFTFYNIEQIALSPYFGVLGYRNCGLFWEPGMFQIYLNLSLLFFTFSKDVKYRSFYLIYLGLTVLSTGSVSGIGCMIFLLGISSLNQESGFRKFSLFIAVIVSLYFLIPFFLELVNTKMTLENSNSYNYRSQDLSLGFELFLDSPLWGHGIVNNVYNTISNKAFGEIRGNSNGWSNVLIDFGLVGAIIYLYGIWFYSKMISSSFNDKLAFISCLVLIVVSINTEPITLHPISFFLVATGFSWKKKSQYVGKN